MASIDEQVEKLSEEDRKQFDKRLLDVLYDRYWCRNHNINYVDPDVEKAKGFLYQEMFDKERFLLDRDDD